MPLRALISAAIAGGAIGMMLIAGNQMGSFLTGFLWICAFLILFLIPKAGAPDSEEDER